VLPELAAEDFPRARFAASSTTNQQAKIRLGSIKAALWRNETEHGTRYGSRLYRYGEQWKSADSYSG
jgi:hypothetical protein